MKTRLFSAAFNVALLVYGFIPALFAASFQGLGDLPGGGTFSVATGVSADGKVVVGYSQSTNGYEAFRWTAATGLVGLGDLPGGSFSSFAWGVSADGGVVVGSSQSSSGQEAFRWTQATGILGLGNLPGGSPFLSLASAVSADGRVVVGYGTSALSGTGREAFRWTTTNGMEGLGELAGGNFDSRAWGVSADGSVVVGESASSNGNEGFRWSAAGGMAGLGDLAGGLFNSIAYGISSDGSTITGYGTVDASGRHEGFRWTATEGMVGLGFLPCDTWTIGRAVSGDGSIIVGDPQATSYKCVFIWDSQNGLRELQSVLSNDYGLNLNGWHLGRATAISPDGRVIVGYGSNPSGQTEAWIANIAPPNLSICRAGGSVILSWPTNSPGFSLQATADLSMPGDWMDVTNAPVFIGTDFTVTNAISESCRFYRLRKP